MNLKRLVEISPALGVFLIFLGFFKLSFYYSHWGIPIHEYLDFSEIILSFLGDLNIIVFFAVLLVIQFIIGMSIVFAIDSALEPDKPSLPAKAVAQQPSAEAGKPAEQSHEGLIQEIDQFFENQPGQALIGIIVFTVVFTALFLIFKKLVFLYFAFAAFVQLFMFFIDKFLGIKNEKVVLQLSTTVIAFLFTLCLAYYDIHATETAPQGIGLITNTGETITTNGDLTYLGKTNKFYMFYDESKKQSFSLSTSEVVKVFQCQADSADHVTCR